MVVVHVNRRNERGAVAILMSLFICFVFIGLAALVVNLGHARDKKQESQNAADASALAAANVLYATGSTVPDYAAAVNAARTYATQNLGVSSAQWDACTDGGHYYVPTAAQAPNTSPCISFTDSTLTTAAVSNPTKVRVRIPTQSVPNALGVQEGASNTLGVAAIARATITSPFVGNCGLCFLGNVDVNNPDFDVSSTAAIAINGNINSGPNSNWTAGSILVTGTVNGVQPSQFNGTNYTPKPAHAEPFNDPYGAMTMPAATGTAGATTVDCEGGFSLNPGTYNNITISPGKQSNKDKPCTLNPGMYVVTGSITVANQATLYGTGVTLFFTCKSGLTAQACSAGNTAGGYLDGKNGDVQLTKGATGFASFAIIYDRLNTSGMFLQGNGTTSYIDGAVYAKSAKITFNGNSKFTFFGGPVVVGGADGVGNQSGISLQNSNTVTLTATPSPPNLDQ